MLQPGHNRMGRFEAGEAVTAAEWVGPAPENERLAIAPVGDFRD
ncbi:MAG: hypothetical protein ACKOIA_04635 [Acidimicrobiia bacterium]